MNSVLASTSSLPARAEASNSAALCGLPFPGAAAFYSAHLPLDVGSHAAVEALFAELAKQSNRARGDNHGDNNHFDFEHGGNS